MGGCFDNSVWDRHAESELDDYLNQSAESEDEDPRNEYNSDDEFDKQQLL